MSIGFVCLIHGGMTKNALYHSYIYIVFCPSGGECMAETMRVESADTDFLTDVIKGSPHIGRVKRSA